MTPAQLDRMRALWENSPELTAKVIGERFGVSKNAVIGLANRRKWTPRSTYGRAAANRRDVLAETGARR